MKTYAHITNGLVFEIIEPAFYDVDVYADVPSTGGEPEIIHLKGDYIPIEDRFTPEFVASLIDITDVQPTPQEGWTYDGQVFAPYVAPPPTASQILATNTATRNYLLDMANRVIPALQDAVDLDDPSANPSLLLQWKQFRVNVNKVVLTASNPTWPVPPQSGYGSSISAPEAVN